MSSGAEFRAQHLRPRTVGETDWHALTPSQQELLRLEGTVTRHVEGLVGEPVHVDVVHQRVRPVGHLAALCLQVDDQRPAVDRRVVAVASGGRQPLFCARTLLRRELLPDDFTERLRAASAGLGAALQDSDVQTSRELLWWGRTPVPRWAVNRGLPTDGLTRTYRFCHDRPFALVTEWFPPSLC